MGITCTQHDCQKQSISEMQGTFILHGCHMGITCTLHDCQMHTILPNLYIMFFTAEQDAAISAAKEKQNE